MNPAAEANPVAFYTFLICFDILKLLASEGQTTSPSTLSNVRKLGISKTPQARFAGSGFLCEHSPIDTGEGKAKGEQTGAAHPCVSLFLV